MARTSRLYLADLGGGGGSEQTTRVYRSVVEVLSVLVPYSDSKLTFLLSPDLESDSQTSVVLCGAQEGRHVAETLAAMRLGLVCWDIPNITRADASVVQEVF